jgi:hypothetical protein
MAGLDPAIHVFLIFAIKTWMPGTRLRQGYAGATSSLGRRSFSEGGKAGHDIYSDDQRSQRCSMSHHATRCEVRTAFDRELGIDQPARMIHIGLRQQ